MASVVHFWSCLCGFHQLICGTSLCLYCDWSSSWGDPMDEWVDHCTPDCEFVLLITKNRRLSDIIDLDGVSKLLFFSFVSGYVCWNSHFTGQSWEKFAFVAFQRRYILYLSSATDYIQCGVSFCTIGFTIFVSGPFMIVRKDLDCWWTCYLYSIYF